MLPMVSVKIFLKPQILGRWTLEILFCVLTIQSNFHLFGLLCYSKLCHKSFSYTYVHLLHRLQALKSFTDSCALVQPHVDCCKKLTNSPEKDSPVCLVMILNNAYPKTVYKFLLLNMK